MRCSVRFVFLKIFIALLFLPLTGTAQEELRLDPNVRPTFQAIELNLNANKTQYNGSVQIKLEVEQPTSTFRFHAVEMTFDRIELQSKTGIISVETQTGKEGIILASTKEELSSGSYTFTIDFNKSYNTKARGLYRMENNGQGYLFTEFEPTDARKAFPCWDEPSYKIPFQLTINIPHDQVAITNTPIESEQTTDNLKTLLYTKTQPIPTYLLAIAAGQLESVPIKNLSVPGRIYTIKGQSHLAEIAAETTASILAEIEKYFGMPYPYKKLDMVAIPDYWSGAMENPGLVTYADNILLIGSDANAPVDQKRFLLAVTSHELAHMWFGDLVTMLWWDDLWLNESFATWLGDKIAHKLYPQYRLDLNPSLPVQPIFRRDALPSTRPIRKQVVSNADINEDLAIAYAKGQKVLQMVEQWIGSEMFRSGVIKYLEKHKWGNATGDDLWNSLSEASGKDVKAVLSSFIEQSGFPLISLANLENGKIEISQKRFLNYGVEAPDQTWIVPLRLKYSNGSQISEKTVLFDRVTKTIQLGENVKWILPDAGAYGYYRWIVPPEMFSHFSENPIQILSDVERVAFIGNIGALFDAGQIHGDDYFSILKGFARYPEPEIIKAVMDNLGSVRQALISSELETAFAHFIREVFTPALDKFDLEKQKNELDTISELRPELIYWLANYGQSSEIITYAKSVARSFMTKPTSVDASLAKRALQITALAGDKALFDAYKSHFENAKTPVQRDNYLSALGYFSSIELQNEALNYALSGPLNVSELFIISRGIRASDNGRNLVFHWMMDNYDIIISKIPDEYAGYMPVFAKGCSEDRLETARQFFAKPGHQTESTMRNLAKVEEVVYNCIKLRKREGEAVRAYLNQMVTITTK